MAEARVAQEAVEVLSDSDPIITSTYVAQVAIESLSTQDRIVTYSFVAQIAIESLSKQDRSVNQSQVASFCIEVLCGSIATFVQWPHNLSGVANSNMKSINEHELYAWKTVAGVS